MNLLRKENVDFTHGNIGTLLIAFAIPIILGELLQNLYNSVDSLVVGNFVGDNAQAAVSVCSTLSNLLIGFFNGMSVGASVIVSRAFGKGKQEELLLSMKVAFTFSVVLGVALSVLGIFLTPWLVRVSDVPSEVYASAVTYLRVYLAGVMFTVIYNIGSGVLRAIGNSKSPFIILTLASGINIVLDIVFVTMLCWGIAGVGIATVISQGISVVLVYRQIKRENSLFQFDLSKLGGNAKIILDIINIGIPSGLQSSLISFSNLFVWRYTSSFNSVTAIAGVGVAQRLDRFAGLPSKAVGLTVTTFVSQNEGAGNHVRAQKGGRISLLLALGVTATLGSIIYIFAEKLVVLFNPSPEVISVGVAMMRTIIPFYGLMSLREVCVGVLRGYGYARVTMVLSLLGMVGVRQLFLYIVMQSHHSLPMIYLCYPIAWAAAAVMVAIYYCYITRYKMRKS